MLLRGFFAVDCQTGKKHGINSKERFYDKNEEQGPDEWTDTSMDFTRTDTSMDQGPSFRTMTKQDYLNLYDGIHSLLAEKKIGREQENELYELIGKQDKQLAAAYQEFKCTGNAEALTKPLKSLRHFKP
mmetsp:Transcript_32326/g.86190  ORF Transcript_32326/g.86190 Transcript_32326/m.86190 type:complete len:129 (-) Transcript_32326:13-399(-)